MAKEKDGGPAFPVVGMQDRNGQSIMSVFNGGMTLRAYFAAKAMEGMLSGTPHDAQWPKPTRAASDAVYFADALLAELEK